MATSKTKKPGGPLPRVVVQLKKNGQVQCNNCRKGIKDFRPEKMPKDRLEDMIEQLKTGQQIVPCILCDSSVFICAPCQVGDDFFAGVVDGVCHECSRR